jgi:hypothetical protein
MYENGGQHSTCPHLRGGTDGAQCHVLDVTVRSIPEVDIHLCLSSHFEICYLYINRLRCLFTDVSCISTSSDAINHNGARANTCC